MRNRILLAIGALIVACIAYAGLVLYPSHQFKIAVDQTLQKLPPDISVTYQSAHYSPMTHRASLRGVAIRPAATPNVDIAIDEVTVSNPNMDFMSSWSAAAANPAAVAPDQPLPLCDEFSLNGVTFHTGTVSATMASGSVKNLRVYPGPLLQFDMAGFIAAQNALLNRAQPPTQEDLFPIFRSEAPLLAGFGSDHFTITDIHGTGKVPAAPSSPETDVVFGVKQEEGDGYDRGMYKGASAQGFMEQVGPLGTFTADKFSISAIDFRKPLALLLDAQSFTPAMLDGLTLGQFEIDGMTFQPADGAPTALGSFTLSNINFTQGLPVSGEFSYSGLKLTRAVVTNPQILVFFDKLELDTATVSLSAAFAWDLDKKHASIHDVKFKVDELGALDLSVDYSDVDSVSAWQQQARLAHAILRYDDASLAGRALKVPGGDPAAFRDQLIAMVRQHATAYGNSPAIAASANAIETFIGSPHSLTLELTPPSPVLITTLETAGTMPPADLVALLGMTVSANQ